MSKVGAYDRPLLHMINHVVVVGRATPQLTCCAFLNLILLCLAGCSGRWDYQLFSSIAFHSVGAGSGKSSLSGLS